MAVLPGQFLGTAEPHQHQNEQQRRQLLTAAQRAAEDRARTPTCSPELSWTADEGLDFYGRSSPLSSREPDL